MGRSLQPPISNSPKAWCTGFLITTVFFGNLPSTISLKALLLCVTKSTMHAAAPGGTLQPFTAMMSFKAVIVFFWCSSGSPAMAHGILKSPFADGTFKKTT